MTVDLEKHAEAILKTIGFGKLSKWYPKPRAAILDAIRAAMIDGARVMREQAAKAIYDATPYMIDPTDEEIEYVSGLDDAKAAVLAIDPAAILARIDGAQP